MYTYTQVSPRHLLAPEQHPSLLGLTALIWDDFPEKTLQESVQ